MHRMNEKLDNLLEDSTKACDIATQAMLHIQAGACTETPAIFNGSMHSVPSQIDTGRTMTF